MTKSHPEIRGIKVRTAEHGPLRTALHAAAIGILAVGALFAGGAFENETQMPNVATNISQINQ